MKKNLNILEVLGRDEGHYTSEYQKTWRNDFDLLDKTTKNCTKEEVQRLYDMINGETTELMNMIKYIINNK